MGNGRTRARGRHRRGIQVKGTEGRGRRDRHRGLYRGPFIPDHLLSTEHGTPRPTGTPISTRRQSSTMPSSSIEEAFSSPIILFLFLDTFDGIEGSSADGRENGTRHFKGRCFIPTNQHRLFRHARPLRRLRGSSTLVEGLRLRASSRVFEGANGIGRFLFIPNNHFQDIGSPPCHARSVPRRAS